MTFKTNSTMIQSPAAISYRQWGDHAGCPVYLFRLQNATGAYVELTNYGATVVSVVVADKDGGFDNVVLGYPALNDYVNDTCYLGATIGRFANRIGGAEFTLDGTAYQLHANDGPNTNHGGNAAFNTRVFDYELHDDSLSFTLHSEDGDGGFPGNLQLTVTYRFTDENELSIDFKAQTDKKTVANFTNHAYFNLSAKGEGVFGHAVKVYADNMLEVDESYIPNGQIKPAGKHAFNGESLESKMMIGDQVTALFNDCYVLTDAAKVLKPAAELIEKTSGRTLKVYTTYPSVMVYTGDYLNGEAEGNFKRPYKPFDGLCLECQYYPDSPNHPDFPSAELHPGEEYHEIIVYKFGTVN
ncbi:galactose mutarotase [Mucilaginibacter sp. ZT4R22]|uniref:Aldose 1-epimerase n=1 Tax=Mucilaginibacter pankratovii TaxID=2772110 RepID=A0ABR7WLN4_9SPHI|nr:aldose epimerase family protein [Mucilaginibacter pankratovii]MBD1363215.1 galactose mutarotase [Mucilaginibacter pankratovii]